jgi:hypothetical protein
MECVPAAVVEWESPFLGPLNERVAANIAIYTVRAGGPRVLDLRDQAKGSCI